MTIFVEEVCGLPHTVAFLNEDLAIRDVGDVLGDFAVDVRDEGGGYLRVFPIISLGVGMASPLSVTEH